MAKALVTGATGFIGRRLVPLLAQRGDQVRCLMRREQSDQRFAPFDVSLVRGDITVQASLAAAVRGIDVVYHIAGATLVRSPRVYHAVNAEGTHNLIRACAEQPNPPKIVFVSSLAAAGPSTADRPRTEADPPAPVSEYGRSKLGAERHLHAAAKVVPATVVRPPGVIGPGDPHNLILFRAARRGLVAAAGSTAHRLSWIDGRDLARLLLLAADYGETVQSTGSRGIYFAAMEEMPTFAEIGCLVGGAVGRAKVRTVALPRSVCRLAGVVNDLRVWLTGRPLLLTSDKMCEAVAGSWTCSAAKARRDLGFTCQVNLAESFRDMTAWYSAHGLL